MKNNDQYSIIYLIIKLSFMWRSTVKSIKQWDGTSNKLIKVNYLSIKKTFINETHHIDELN